MYQLNSEKMFYDMEDGQAIVINFTTGMYYGTNALGSVILDRLVSGKRPEKILEAVQSMEGCPENIEENIYNFIAELMEKEILIPGDSVPDGEEKIDKDVLVDGWELTLDEFAEVQDLLLADPIHDVEEIGWPKIKEE